MPKAAAVTGELAQYRWCRKHQTSVIRIYPHTTSAVAIEDSELMVFPREKLFGLYEKDPKLFGLLILNIVREACRRLNQTEEVMLHNALGGSPD